MRRSRRLLARQQESNEQHELRLQARRERQRQESSEQRELRLQTSRERQRQRRQQESSEQRQQCLDRLRTPQVILNSFYQLLELAREKPFRHCCSSLTIGESTKHSSGSWQTILCMPQYQLLCQMNNHKQTNQTLIMLNQTLIMLNQLSLMMLQHLCF